MHSTSVIKIHFSSVIKRQSVFSVCTLCVCSRTCSGSIFHLSFSLYVIDVESPTRNDDLPLSWLVIFICNFAKHCVRYTRMKQVKKKRFTEHNHSFLLEIYKLQKREKKLVLNTSEPRWSFCRMFFYALTGHILLNSEWLNACDMIYRYIYL